MRLQKCLTGDAKEAVEGLLIHPANVGHVIRTLAVRFGAPEMLIRSQIAKIRQVRPISEDDAKGFVKFATLIRNTVALFTASQVEQHIANPSLIDEIVVRLPLSYKRDWVRYRSRLRHYATLRDLDSWIDEEAQLLSMVDTSCNYSAPKSSRGQPKGVLLVTPQDEDAKQAESSEGVDEPEKIASQSLCLVCESAAHSAQKCPSLAEMSLGDRWRWVKESRVCFACLRKGHQLSKCRKKKQCVNDGCQHFHHPVLHDSTPSSTVKPTAEGDSPTVKPMLCLRADEAQVAFRILPVELIGPKGKSKVYALMDEGACTSMMDKGLAQKLGLHGDEDCLLLQWYDEKVTKEKATVVSCDIEGMGTGCKRLRLRNVRAIERLNLPQQSLVVDELVSKYPLLDGLPLIGYQNVKPLVLIGLNNAHLTFSRKTIDCSPDGPLAVQTPLGWVVYGPTGMPGVSQQKSSQMLVVHESKHDRRQQEDLEDLRNTVAEYLEFESFGVKYPTKALLSKDDERALTLLSRTTQFVDGHYQTGLLWKEDEGELPNNYETALRRLHGLRRRLSQRPGALQRYEEALMQYVDKRYARRLLEEEIRPRQQRDWFLPHFQVDQPAKNKIRVVFDAACKTQGKSLNTELLSGPDMNQPMTKVLLRFREGLVAVCADIREWFCQIRIAPSDRRSQRFLWQRFPQGPIEVYEMESMVFGSASSPCSAQYCKMVNAERLSGQYPEAARAVKEDFFADDFVKCFTSVEEAKRISKQVRRICQEGGFELRNFISNSPEVRKSFTDDESALKDMNLVGGEHREKILGMYWNVDSDEFLFDFKFHRVPKPVIEGQRTPTKRELLSIVMSVFDPFGFLANVLLNAKVILQDTWSMPLDWDDELPNEMNTRIQAWLECLKDASRFRVPRCHSEHLSTAQSLELHIFTDASETAMAAVAYWRVRVHDKVEVSFIMGKVKCAPKKVMSIPRLELQAAVFGARLRESILAGHSVKPSQTIMWSDSKTVILWIRSVKRQYKPFVAHRIAEILSLTEEGSWKWLESKMNPADDGTRVQLDLKCDSTCRWVVGPNFLRHDPSSWPADPDDLDRHEIDQETRSVVPVLLMTFAQPDLPDPARFSKYTYLIRSVAYLNRAINIFRAYNQPNKIVFPPAFPAAELMSAEKEVCRQAQ